jgi:hypothetical protein
MMFGSAGLNQHLFQIIFALLVVFSAVFFNFTPCLPGK